MILLHSVQNPAKNKSFSKRAARRAVYTTAMASYGKLEDLDDQHTFQQDRSNRNSFCRRSLLVQALFFASKCTGIMTGSRHQFV